MGLAGAIFVIGIYSSKVVVIEMMGVMQVSAFGLLLINVYYPLINSLYVLKYSNGYADIFPKSQSNLPVSISRTGTDELVCNNLNIIIPLILIPLLSGLVFYVLSVVQRKNKTSNLSKFKLCMGEWTMLVVLFFIYNLSTSTSIFLRFSTSRNWQF